MIFCVTGITHTGFVRYKGLGGYVCEYPAPPFLSEARSLVSASCVIHSIAIRIGSLGQYPFSFFSSFRCNLRHNHNFVERVRLFKYS